jgi:mono/diheme cytochrome c family protein
MRRHLTLILCVPAALALAVLASACGTDNGMATSSTPSSTMQTGAVLFNQRCAGCHTLSQAAGRGSAANVRTAQYNNGPNLNVRCERPVARVLYAIENGGFSGAIMPQNIVTGQQALAVARFVSTYAGSQIGNSPGVVPCKKEPVGSIPTAASVAPATKSGASQVSAAAGNKKVKGVGGAPIGNTQPNSGASKP